MPDISANTKKRLDHLCCALLCKYQIYTPCLRCEAPLSSNWYNSDSIIEMQSGVTTYSCVTFQTLYISSSIVDGYCNYDLGLQRVKSSNARRICIKPRWQLTCHINIWLILFPFESIYIYNGVHN